MTVDWRGKENQKKIQQNENFHNRKMISKSILPFVTHKKKHIDYCCLCTILRSGKKINENPLPQPWPQILSRWNRRRRATKTSINQMDIAFNRGHIQINIHFVCFIWFNKQWTRWNGRFLLSIGHPQSVSFDYYLNQKVKYLFETVHLF